MEPDDCPAGSPQAPLPEIDCTYTSHNYAVNSKIRIPLLSAEGETPEENNEINICMPIGEVEDVGDHVLEARIATSPSHGTQSEPSVEAESPKPSLQSQTTSQTLNLRPCRWPVMMSRELMDQA